MNRAAGVHVRADDTIGVCARPWNLDVIGGNGQIVVICANDVRRQALVETSAIADSLFVALDPARERVCACARRMGAPSFVDLVFTAKPADGRTTVEATCDEDVDPVLGPPFAACVGTVALTYAPLASAACPDGKASLVYPVRLELADRPPPGAAP